MRRTGIVACCLPLALMFACCANAGIIGSWTIREGWSSSIQTELKANLSVGQDMTDWFGRTCIFNGSDAGGYPFRNGISLLDHIGETFWVGSDQDDPDFSAFVSRITDGVVDNVQADFEDGHGGVSWWVPLYRVRGWPDVGNYNFDLADLYGYRVERIGLTVDSASYTFASGAEYPHKYAWQVTYTFEGTPVPEPSPFLALFGGVGGFGIISGLRRRWARA